MNLTRQGLICLQSMLCEAKLPFLLSLLSYLFSGNDNLREERRPKREKLKEQKNDNLLKENCRLFCERLPKRSRIKVRKPKSTPLFLIEIDVQMLLKTKPFHNIVINNII